MKREDKLRILILTPLALGFLLGFLSGSCTKGLSYKHKEAKAEAAVSGEQEEIVQEVEAGDVIEDSEVGDAPETPAPRKEIIYNRSRLPLRKMFNDLNDAHLQAAQKYGLKEVPRTRDDIDKRKLVEVRDNDYIKVWNLKYSVPYLTRSAASELDAISRAFSDSLRNHRLLPYKIVVSSVLRTSEDVDRLRRSGNSNASANSAHCYGTTFDIAYTRYWRDDEQSQEAFMQPFELTKVLGEVLRDRKAAGKILCKYERTEHCFHITVRY